MQSIAYNNNDDRVNDISEEYKINLEQEQQRQWKINNNNNNNWEMVYGLLVPLNSFAGSGQMKHQTDNNNQYYLKEIVLSAHSFLWTCIWLPMNILEFLAEGFQQNRKRTLWLFHKNLTWINLLNGIQSKNCHISNWYIMLFKFLFIFVIYIFNIQPQIFVRTSS